MVKKSKFTDSLRLMRQVLLVGSAVIGLTMSFAQVPAGAATARASSSDSRVIVQHRHPASALGLHRRFSHAPGRGMRTPRAKEPFAALPTTNTSDPECDFYKIHERWDPVKC